MAWDEELILSDDDIIKAMKKNDDVSSEAMMVAGRRKIESIIPDLEILLESEVDDQRASAATAIIQIGSEISQNAESIINDMLNSDDELVQATALKRLIYNDSILTTDKLIEFLKNEGHVISNVALTIAEKRNDEELIPAIISKNIKKFDAFIALGCVIKGETPHFDFISKASIEAIMNLSVESKKPIGNGIITCLNMKQAMTRKNNKGKEAANAVNSFLDELELDNKDMLVDF